MELFFSNIDYWHWLILGGVLLIIEVIAPSFFFLWLSIAAAITGLVLLVIPNLGWEYQLLIFSGLSIVSITALRRYQRSRKSLTDQPTLNRRGEQYIGRTFTLTEPIINNNGVIRVDDSTWRINGADLPAGSTVKVVGADGVILQVEVVNK
ncbi:MAG TPA: NfeD family protein [Halieaceae bacterium]|nr:NfeD family protein [Halieaceae bacterium]